MEKTETQPAKEADSWTATQKKSPCLGMRQLYNSLDACCYAILCVERQKCFACGLVERLPWTYYTALDRERFSTTQRRFEMSIGVMTRGTDSDSRFGQLVGIAPLPPTLILLARYSPLLDDSIHLSRTLGQEPADPNISFSQMIYAITMIQLA